VIVEACVPSAESAVRAATGGAGRVELCENLVEGGTTPSAGTIALTKERLDVPVMVMIRPRGGDFCYTDLEVDVMLRDIAMARALGADGLVFGVLQPDGRVDALKTAALVAAAGPLPVTFHRAFDVSHDAFEALDTLVELGVERILTSGQQPTVREGLPLIRELAARCLDTGTRLLPGGGLAPEDVEEVLAVPGIDEIHVYAATDFPSPMRHRNESVIMGRAYDPDEYLRTEIDPEGLRVFVEAAGRAG
jgi:copper homeostasis protein